MKLTLALVLIGLLAIPVVYAAEQCVQQSDLAEDKLQARIGFAEYRAERHLLAMDAIINYLDDAGNDTSTLEDLNADFETKSEELSDANDEDELDATIDDMKDIVKDFKNEVEDMDLDDDVIDEINDAIQEKFDDNEDNLDEKLQGAAENGKSFMQGRFEAAFCVAENAIDKLDAKDVDVSDAEAKLADIKQKELELTQKFEDAVLSCDTTSMGSCDSDEMTDFESAKTELAGDFKDLKDMLKEAREDRMEQGNSGDEDESGDEDTNDTEDVNDTEDEE